MKNLNWSKMRFICIFLAFSLVILGYFFRNHYYYQFLGLAYICIAISNICLYLFELKEKGHSSKSYILGAIMLVILAIFFSREKTPEEALAAAAAVIDPILEEKPIAAQ